jgi:hypothetical protein
MVTNLNFTQSKNKRLKNLYNIRVLSKETLSIKNLLKIVFEINNIGNEKIVNSKRREKT